MTREERENNSDEKKERVVMGEDCGRWKRSDGPLGNSTPARHGLIIHILRVIRCGSVKCEKRRPNCIRNEGVKSLGLRGFFIREGSLKFLVAWVGVKVATLDGREPTHSSGGANVD